MTWEAMIPLCQNCQTAACRVLPCGCSKSAKQLARESSSESQRTADPAAPYHMPAPGAVTTA